MPSKIQLIKSIDKIIGKSLVNILSGLYLKRDFLDLSKISEGKFLFIRPGGIGDAVLLLPSIKALRVAYPEATIDVLCEKRNSGVFDLTEDLNRIYLYDRDFDLFMALKNRYDVVIDTEQWHRLSAVVAYLSKAPVRIGFSTNERERLFTYRIPYSHDDYEVHSFFNLIRPLTGYIPEFNHDQPFIDIKDGVTAFKEYLSDNTIALFPGATVPERRWGGKRFGMVAEELIKRGFNIVILGSSTERCEAKEIIEIARGAIDLTGKTSLKEVALILKRCRLLITADSGIMHIAVGVGTPTVSLFGSGIEKKWAPKGKRHRVINKNLSCSPCTRFGYTPECKTRDCLELITVEEVLKSVEELLSL